MFANLNGWHLIILLAVILLLFGAAKLPALAKSVGQSARILKGEIREGKREAATANEPVDVAASAVSPAPRTTSHADAPRESRTD